MGTTAIAPGSFRAWVLAARPPTLTVAIAPVLVGTAVAWVSREERALHWWAGAAALASALCIQIGTNFANDVFDYEKGADTGERLGGMRATQAGLLTPGQVKLGMAASFLLAVLPGAYLVWSGGIPILLLGLLSIASGIAYTGGPYPLGYHGLGDLFVFVFFGLAAVVGTVFVETGSVSPLAWLSSVPIGALATATLVVNNTRDHRTDVLAGKRTLVVRWGQNFGRAEYVLLCFVAFLVPCVLYAMGLVGRGVFLSFLCAPLALRWTRFVMSEEGRSLQPALAGTAQLLLLYSVLFSLGILL